ncbi:MAG: heme-binding protein [Gammaproteobacteria bacterium]|nr:heme-binding protein [Gammaproteobacteria bacterium]
MRLFKILFALALLLLVSAGKGVADEHALFTTHTLIPETALKAATAALKKCRAEGYQVAVAVVDRMGNMQVMIRDRFAGAHTPDTARRKAWTAASFRTNTTDLLEITGPGQPQAGIRHVTGALMIGGGMLIEAAGSLVGAIGVSGAPGGDQDDLCAAAGIAAIEADISF